MRFPAPYYSSRPKDLEHPPILKAVEWVARSMVIEASLGLSVPNDDSPVPTNPIDRSFLDGIPSLTSIVLHYRRIRSFSILDYLSHPRPRITAAQEIWPCSNLVELHILAPLEQ
jgi:hypothetical protein